MLIGRQKDLKMLGFFLHKIAFTTEV